MSIGPARGIIGSAAGVGRAEKQARQKSFASHEASAPHHSVGRAEEAVDAAGLAQAEKDREISDRDPDGRRSWEPGQPVPEAESKSSKSGSQREEDGGERGSILDLRG